LIRQLFKDTIPSPSGVQLRFPLQDRRGDEASYPNKNTFDLKKPSSITDSIAYDPATKMYYLYEKVGRSWYRKPGFMTFEEMVAYKSRQQEVDYFQRRLNTTLNLNRKIDDPKLRVQESFFNRLFSNTGIPKVEIRPQGDLTITAGYIGQNIKNPTLPERARRNGGFDFDMQANFGLNAKIGDKLNFPLTYNTLANFQFENQLKLDYTGGTDQIIKRLEAGNIAFPARGTLMPGASTLFGIKSELQFGKLYVTTVLANQNSSRQQMQLQGGTGLQNFIVKADEYEENRHFLLGQYFRKNYNKNMKNLPAVTSPVQILRMEVWVTNRTGSTTENRNVVALMDLGEKSPYNDTIKPLFFGELPENNSNDLYGKIVNDPSMRDASFVTSRLGSLGLQAVQDFERTFARKLRPEEYYFNPQIGFISLNTILQPDEVLGVAYQYSVNGRVYQVGEFSNDVTPDTSANNTGTQKVLFLKMLKATSQRPGLPIWDLMMKNVYAVGFGQLERKDFKFNIIYQEPGGGEKRYISEGEEKGRPIIELVNLDRLNNQNDPQPDGVFDYIEGFTVISQQSRIIFPLLEPFGEDLKYIFRGSDSNELRTKYLFYPLYDSIKWVAQQSPQLNRFVFKGMSKSAGGNSEIPIGAFNVPPGSVTVSAGGQTLRENIDYVVDYNLGTVKIINQAIVNSGIPIQVGYENNATFGMQNRNFMALRLDYKAIELPNKQLTIGGAMMRLSERPFFTKMNYGEDPIRNTMVGGDINFRSDWKRLTKWLDAIPFYSTRQTSTINIYGEAARIFPSTPPQIRPEKGGGGLIYIDDFEGTRNGIDLRFPFVAWTLASTPFGAKDRLGNNLFPEAAYRDSLPYGFNRAKIAWYNIEPVLQEKNGQNNPLSGNTEELSDPRVRFVNRVEVFPQTTPDLGQNQLITFDLAFYPTERGPYNYDVDKNNIDPLTGKFKNPQKKWGGIMRAIDQIDFETNNIEFIEMWVQDPFIKQPNSKGGQLYFNLGNISEDVLKDGRRFYENGLSTTQTVAREDTSNWARVPRNPIQVAQAFSNVVEERPQQDVGFDGFTDEQERTFKSDFLSNYLNNFGNTSGYQTILNDPSSDNYRHFRDEFYNQQGAGILARYKNFNNPHGNSPVSNNEQAYTPASTLYPDNEDLNRDNTLNEMEEYFQYSIEIQPKESSAMQVGQGNYIADRREVDVRLANGNTRKETWYLFRIPIRQYKHKVGNIPDFKSIRFMRMYMTGFEDSLVLRFGKLELVRNMWRTFQYELSETGNYVKLDTNSLATFNLTAVNVEENDRRVPVNYVIPPGIERVQQLSNNGLNLLQNEQSLSMQVCELADGESRSIFKSTNFDFRQYKRVRMFMHAESRGKIDNLQDDQLYAVIRFGTDFINNYYEVRMPLKVTKWGSFLKDVEVWPAANEFDLDLEELVKFKLRRTGGVLTPYKEDRGNGILWGVMGNPNLGEVKGILVGIENKTGDNATSICAEVWVNELRLSGLDEKGGWAATGRMDIQLADLGSISLSGSARSIGFGTIEQRVNERSREFFTQLDVATNMQLGKLLPKSVGLEIPFYASYSQTVTTPEYDPYDQDVNFKDKLKNTANKDSLKRISQDFVGITTVNVTNLRKNKMNDSKPKVYDISNFDLSYSYTKTERRSPLIESDELIKHYGGLGYNFSPQPNFIEPFKKFIKYRNKWWNIIKEINFNLKPSLLSFRADVTRQFGATRAREVQIPGVPPSPFKIPETYDKYFIFDRVYNFRWDATRSINFDFSATNNARVDEPAGRINTREKRDSILSNLLKGGRNVIYRQNANASYNLPLSKIPVLDWTNFRVNYATTYNWVGASRIAINLGNTVENSLQRVITGQFDFSRLYTKSKWLAALENPSTGGKKITKENMKVQLNPKDTIGKSKKYIARLLKRLKRLEDKKNKTFEPEWSNGARIFGNLLTALKNININYTESYNSRIPGFTDSPRYIGNNWGSQAPGLDYVFGRQPDVTWLQSAAKSGWMTRDTNFNFMFTQSYKQELKVEASVQPIRDLTIDVSLTRSFSKNYTSLFKDTTGQGAFANLNPYASGGFDISFISYQTLFQKYSATSPSEAFLKFEENRRVLSQRLGANNPYTNNQVQTDGYYKGYGRYAQDVLISSFIAAYTGEDPLKVGLVSQRDRGIDDNPFKRFIPRPNWRFTYNGLTRLPFIEKFFTNFTITHGYNSNLSMNNFASALLYADAQGLGFPSFIDTISKNYVPFFLVPNITISEKFSPLLGIDMQLTNQVSVRFDYGRSRSISLSLVDFQVSEVRSVDITFGAGWRKRGLKFPFKLPFSKGSKKLENDISFRLDMTYKDNAISNNILDQRNTIPTGGQKVLSLNPSIDYVLNNRIRLRLFMEQTRVIGYIATPPPVVNTRAGLQVNISLAQ
jgi:cell surface protein SprA